jgi:hypothetical protein
MLFAFCIHLFIGHQIGEERVNTPEEEAGSVLFMEEGNVQKGSGRNQVGWMDNGAKLGQEICELKLGDFGSSTWPFAQFLLVPFCLLGICFLLLLLLAFPSP